MRVLLTGGAGYVGSACFRAFRRKGLEAFVLDDLSEGHAAAVEPDRLDVADLRDTEAVARVLRDRDITHVVHFAAKTSVPEFAPGPERLLVDQRRRLAQPARGDARRSASGASSSPARRRSMPTASTGRSARPTRSCRRRPTAPRSSPSSTCSQGYADAYGFGATALRYFNASGRRPRRRARRGAPRSRRTSSRC